MEQDKFCYIGSLSTFEGKQVTLRGWLYNRRSSKSLQFLEFRDGTGICQCVVSKKEVSEEVWSSASELTQESSLILSGFVVRDDRSEGGYEIHVSDLKPVQITKEYPITPKEHGIEFLMENRHLWLRSRRQWATMRVRNRIIHAIHGFFQNRGFIQMDAPIFTGNAAEGTTTLFETDYFDETAYLTQSGQLYAEAMAMAHGRVYTFGPTFRAEKSKTRRHLTEFWMAEPEMAYYDLEMTIDLAEALIQSIIREILNSCRVELNILDRDPSALEKCIAPFERISYSEAVDRLRSDDTVQLLEQMREERIHEQENLSQEKKDLSGEYGSAKKWRKVQIDQRLREIGKRLDQIEEDLRNIPEWKASAAGFEWGSDFGGSDETILTLQANAPLIVHRYPAEVKAFYMKRDPQETKLSLAMDLLAPEGYGEIIGGSQREENENELLKRLKEHQLSEETFKWYLDLRRYGSVPHSGFGLGIERTVAWICGSKHVRETIPFPRMPGRLTP